MRDPNRIARILQLVGEIWRIVPDLRLGQIIADASPGAENNLFYFEDENLECDLIVFRDRLRAAE